MATILIVDDEPSARTTLGLLLRKRSHRVTEVEGVAAAVKALTDEAFDVIVTDLRMPDGDGLDVLRAVKAHAPATEVILLTAYAEWKSAKEAIRLGALDYFEKGQEPDELNHRIDKALAGRELRRENENLRAQLRERYGLPGLIARSPAMLSVLDLVARVAPTDATVMIQGESGTGKEVIAKAIHHASARAARPFVAINCGAIPETLLESELFGHEKGSFTGAHAQRKGKIESANGGTLFLDEITEMSLPLQVKLLRFLQEREIERVGGRDVIPIDVRVVAASNQSLEEALRSGRFREDLYYRLSVVTIHLPPLRDRGEDVVLLANAFLRRNSQALKRKARFSPEALEAIVKYPWPGNIRELENMIKRVVILQDEQLVVQEIEHRRYHILQRGIERQNLARHFLADGLCVVAEIDLEIIMPEQLDNRQIGCRMTI
jgi:DNA-binding NtrC family response regulator